MKLKFVRIILLLVALWYLPTMIGWYQGLRAYWDKYYPDLSRAYAGRRAEVKTPESWRPQGAQVTTIPWHNRQGPMMGTVSARRWEETGKTFYEITGPVSPETKDNDYILEVIYRQGTGFRIERFGAERAMLYASNGQMETPRGALPQSRYKITTPTAGQIRIVFWTLAHEPPGNLVFHYREGEEIAWLAMDKGKAPNRYASEFWTLNAKQGN